MPNRNGNGRLKWKKKNFRMHISQSGRKQWKWISNEWLERFATTSAREIFKYKFVLNVRPHTTHGSHFHYISKQSIQFFLSIISNQTRRQIISIYVVHTTSFVRLELYSNKMLFYIKKWHFADAYEIWNWEPRLNGWVVCYCLLTSSHGIDDLMRQANFQFQMSAVRLIQIQIADLFKKTEHFLRIQ